jgi:hypothetical protein
MILTNHRRRYFASTLTFLDVFVILRSDLDAVLHTGDFQHTAVRSGSCCLQHEWARAMSSRGSCAGRAAPRAPRARRADAVRPIRARAVDVAGHGISLGHADPRAHAPIAHGPDPQLPWWQRGAPRGPASPAVTVSLVGPVHGRDAPCARARRAATARRSARRC